MRRLYLAVLLIKAMFSFGSLAMAQSDSSPPAYSNLQVLTPEVVGGASPGVVRVRLTITDNLSGFHQGSIVFRGPTPTPYVLLSFGQQDRVQGTSLNGVYEVSQRLSAFFPVGTYRLETLTLWDVAGNGLDFRHLAHSFQVVTQAPQESVNEYSVFPQVAFGGDWETIVYLVNSTTGAQSLRLEFFSDEGVPVALPFPGAAGNAIEASVTPRRVNVIALRSNGPLLQGWFRVKLPTGIRGYVVFRQLVRGREDKESSVLLEKFLTNESFYACDETSGVVTGVAIANPNAHPINITLEVIATSGIGSESRSITIPALSKRAFQLNQPGANLGLFTLRVTAGGQLFSSLLLRFTPGFAFSTLPNL